MDEVKQLAQKVTYKFERHVSYDNGEMYTDAKIFTTDADADNFYEIHSYFYGFLRSAFGHAEAPLANWDGSSFTEKKKECPCATCIKNAYQDMTATYEDWK